MPCTAAKTSATVKRPQLARPHAPVGSRHKLVHRSKSPTHHHIRLHDNPIERARVEAELETLPELIRSKFKGWTDGAKDFQLQCMRNQVLQTDTILHAATGSGKTGIAAGPHLLPCNQGKVTLLVSPLIVLHKDQVCCI